MQEATCNCFFLLMLTPWITGWSSHSYRQVEISDCCDFVFDCHSIRVPASTLLLVCCETCIQTYLRIIDISS